MIISHKYKFIFIKSFKTAGTSLEVFLSKHCDEKDDILTTIYPPVYPHKARNNKGYFNPFPEIVYNGFNLESFRHTFRNLYYQDKFYSHISAYLIKSRIDNAIWNNYFKFTIERNPWEKVVSYYYMYNKQFNLNLSFDEFIEREEFPYNYPLYSDKTDNILVDKIIRYENLNEELKEVLSKFNIEFESLNTRAKDNYRKERQNYKMYYNNQTKNIVSRYFDKEIQLMGYNF